MKVITQKQCQILTQFEKELKGGIKQNERKI